MSILPKGYLTFSNIAEAMKVYLIQRKREIEWQAFKKECFNKFNISDSAAKQIFYQAYWYIKKSGQVVEKKKNGHLYIKLMGKVQLAEVNDKFKTDQKMPNGEKILVIFDIPQDHTGERNYFRSFLKRHNFKLIQRSVLVSEFDVLLDLREFIKETGLEEWVKVFIISKQVKM